MEVRGVTEAAENCLDKGEPAGLKSLNGQKVR